MRLRSDGMKKYWSTQGLWIIVAPLGKSAKLQQGADRESGMTCNNQDKGCNSRHFSGIGLFWLAKYPLSILFCAPVGILLVQS